MHMKNMLSIQFMSPGLCTKYFFILYAKIFPYWLHKFFVQMEGKIKNHPIGTDSNFIRNPAWKMNK